MAVMHYVTMHDAMLHLGHATDACFSIPVDMWTKCTRHYIENVTKPLNERMLAHLQSATRAHTDTSVSQKGSDFSHRQAPKLKSDTTSASLGERIENWS